MEDWRKDARREPILVDLEVLVPETHLLRKIERVMDYEWLYERLAPYYCHDNGRPGADPVVLIKMVLIQHLFGIPSLRQTHRTPDTRPRGLQRRPWTMERFRFSPTQDTPEAKTATSRGNTPMILPMTPIPALAEGY